MKKLQSMTLAACMGLSVGISANTPYDASQHYPSGSQVSFNGYIYEAKWWANPGQSPGDSVQQAWETPWRLLTEDSSEPNPPTDPADDPTEPPPINGN